MTAPPRYAIFGDESTLPRMAQMLGASVAAVVTASARPQSAGVSACIAAATPALQQPPRSAHRYQTFLRDLEALRPDFLLCFSYSMLLGPEVLALPRHGAINIHGGLLPAYRGANVVNWVLIEGASETGVTAHYMTARIDAGDIVMQEKVAIDRDDTALTLKTKLDDTGFRILERLHRAICAKEALPRRPQDESKARHYKRRKPEDGRIDWRCSNEQIYNLVRALVAPWPGAFFYDRLGQKVVLDRRLTLQEIQKLREDHAQ